MQALLTAGISGGVLLAGRGGGLIAFALVPLMLAPLAYERRVWLAMLGIWVVGGIPLAALMRTDAATLWTALFAVAAVVAVANQLLDSVVESRARARARLERRDEELRRSQQLEAIGRLAGGVAHDFGNLLTVLRGNLELLRDADPGVAPDPERLDEGLAEIERAVERAEGLTRDLAIFARRKAAPVGELDARQVIADLEPVLRRLLEEGVKLRVTEGDDATPLRLDRPQLEQVILNLVLNARDAMPDGGSLRVSTRRVPLSREQRAAHPDASPGDYVELCVQDAGVGIEPEVRERMFEPFFTTREGEGGRGLGLSIVYGTVTRAGGFLEVESEGGRGTTVRVLLPAEGGPLPGAAARGAGRAASGRSATVLLCDDETKVLELAWDRLERAGHSVFGFASSSAALAWARARRQPLDLLVTDVMMPELDGRSLADAVREAHPEAQALFISGHPAEAIAPEGVLEEGIEFLAKPFEPGTLVERVREILEAGGQPPAARAHNPT